MNQNERLFWDLFHANSEKEVDAIMKGNPIFQNPDNWTPYGNNRGNFGTFESQQNHPVPAIVEKITNSIDATLIKDAKVRGIDPKSSDAPRSMGEAVEQFYGIAEGSIGQLTPAKRRSLAENIQIIATGDKQVPSLVIYDNGEGQNPDNFHNTFLSLHNNNKTNIHFVQGKYNMGSTGAIVFCGEKKYQLIGSKRNLQLNDGNGEFGFTLVRRHPLSATEEQEYGKSTWYEYFSPNGHIASFEAKELDLGLYGRHFKSGSIVKLYSYQLPKGSRSNITFDLWRDLNQYMYKLPLPITLYEKRDYVAKNPTKILLGNETRINVDGRENVKEHIPFFIPKEAGLGEIAIDVIIFNPDVEHNEFIKNKSLIFTQNGQVHGYEGQSFISQELGYSLLKKNMLIHVNCDNIPTSVRQDLFMANRTHLKNGHKAELLRKEIISLLKKSDELKRIHNEVKNSLLQSSDSDDSMLRSVLSNLPADNEIMKILKKGGNLDFLTKHSEILTNKGEENEIPHLKKLPTIFNLNLKTDEEKGKVFTVIPRNSKGTVEILTDVENDYLLRPQEKGQMKVEIHQKEEDDDDDIIAEDTLVKRPPREKINDILIIRREGPVNGKIKLVIEPTDKAVAGEELEVRAVLSNPDGTEMECKFIVKVDEEISKTNKKDKKPTVKSFPSLPTARKAYHHPTNPNDLAWNSPELNWTGDDIVKVITSKDDDNNELMVAGIIVNMDSFALKRFFEKNHIKSESEIRYNRDKYFISIYLHSLVQFSILKKMREEDESLKSIEVDEFVSSMTKPYATYLLYQNHHVDKMAFSDN